MRALLVVAVLAVLVAGTACEVERRDDVDPGPPAAPPTVEPQPIAPAEIPFEEDAWPAHQLEVMNESDREVAIIVIVEGRVQELGSVGPEESTHFELRAESGAAVHVEARDAGDRLVSETTLRAGPPVLHWTVRH